MDIKNTISATEARQRFAEVLDQVDRTGAHYTLTVNGKPKAVLMNAEELESLQESLILLSERAALLRIQVAEKEFERGDSISLDELLSNESST